MVSVHSLLCALHRIWQVLPAPVYGGRFWESPDDRATVFVDIIALLLCGVGKISGGRDSSGGKRHAAVYGCHFHRFDSASGFGLPSFQCFTFGAGYLGGMAHRMDNRNDTFRFLLPKGIQKNERPGFLTSHFFKL